MRYLPNLSVCVTVEAATLIGLSFVAATSYFFRSVMARRKKSGAPKPFQAIASTSTAATTSNDANSNGLAQAKPAIVVDPATQEVDTRPETSPYGSPACTIPFASPLTLPLDVLRKSPKLHAAYESRLPELLEIPESVGHVLVHHLHTGAYQSLKPKQTDSMSKQTGELKTSIQAYAAARAYDLPDLMHLADLSIAKHGDGLPLPALLEVARDAYPTLTEGDGWFLDYLRLRIRPHLQDPTLLLRSNLLDQISSILSPNRVLLRTVLELFCEKITIRPEPVTSPPTASTLASPITSPGSYRPVSPLPPAISGKDLKGTPWPSPDNVSEPSQPPLEAKPVSMPQPVASLAPMPELGPVILDVVLPPGPSIEARTVDDKGADPALAMAVKVSIEPESETDVEPESEMQLPVKPEVEAPAEPETTVAAEPEVGQVEDLETISNPAAVVQRERKDSRRGIGSEYAPYRKPDAPPELETEPRIQSQVQRCMLREADSGFWEGPDVMDAGKELVPSLVEIEPLAVSAPEFAHESETGASQRNAFGIDTRDFPSLDKQATPEPEPTEERNLVPVLAHESASAATTEIVSKAAPESKPPPEHLSIKMAEKVADSAVQAVPGDSDISAAEVAPEGARSTGAEAQPETEKLQEKTVAPEVPAKPEPKPKAEPLDPVPASDDSQPAGPAEPETPRHRNVEPEPEPAGKFEILQCANTDSAAPAAALRAAADAAAKSPAMVSTKPAPRQEQGAKTEAVTVDVQPCGTAQGRQRSWKKRFLSLRTPALFGHGM
ncbi:hypothetical protein N657DRAFT_636040 [Parathielavia appendiculata]|uniref:Uncharacterized protein n=1 Tax=Parathielavia appendiculata TaxID=2587402 RepID=A0AAN6Z0K2_9PEZI|nr:hypothetical protein N657DRAFT_636040 [Parathielavia appendiculata]